MNTNPGDDEPITPYEAYFGPRMRYGSYTAPLPYGEVPYRAPYPHSVVTPRDVPADALKPDQLNTYQLAILQRLEQLFTESSLSIDEEFLAEVRKTRQGWVDWFTIIKRLGLERSGITIDEMRYIARHSTVLVTSDDGLTIRKKHPMRKIIVADVATRIAFVENIGPSLTLDRIESVLSRFGEIQLIKVILPGSADETRLVRGLASLSRRWPTEPRYCLVLFASEAGAQAAARAFSPSYPGITFQLSYNPPSRAESRDGGGGSGRGGHHAFAAGTLENLRPKPEQYAPGSMPLLHPLPLMNMIGIEEPDILGSQSSRSTSSSGYAGSGSAGGVAGGDKEGGEYPNPAESFRADARDGRSNIGYDAFYSNKDNRRNRANVPGKNGQPIPAYLSGPFYDAITASFAPASGGYPGLVETARLPSAAVSHADSAFSGFASPPLHPGTGQGFKLQIVSAGPPPGSYQGTAGSSRSMKLIQDVIDHGRQSDGHRQPLTQGSYATTTYGTPPPQTFVMSTGDDSARSSAGFSIGRVSMLTRRSVEATDPIGIISSPSSARSSYFDSARSDLSTTSDSGGIRHGSIAKGPDSDGDKGFARPRAHGHREA